MSPPPSKTLFHTVLLRVNICGVLFDFSLSVTSSMSHAEQLSPCQFPQCSSSRGFLIFLPLPPNFPNTLSYLFVSVAEKAPSGVRLHPSVCRMERVVYLWVMANAASVVHVTRATCYRVLGTKPSSFQLTLSRCFLSVG